LGCSVAPRPDATRQEMSGAGSRMRGRRRSYRRPAGGASSVGPAGIGEN
jgi:hypothetical protein